MKNKRLYTILIAIPFLLLIPLIGMQFSSEVNWTFSDFLVMGLLLLGLGLMIEFVMRTVKRKKYRIALMALVVIMFLAIWAEMAVGIFGTPIAGS